MPTLRDNVEALLHSVHHPSPMLLRFVPLARQRQVTRGALVSRIWIDNDEPRFDWTIVLDVLMFIGRLLWTLTIILVNIFLAIMLGGFRGAMRSKVSNGGAARD